MNALDRLIRAEIATGGPMTVSRYMSLCLLHPQHGYYTRGNPLGTEGDFTTAPEISQLFGELVAVWLITVWRALGAPAPFTLLELGPGRGTLMADILRTARIDPAFLAAVQVHLVEASEALRAVQQTTLRHFDQPVIHLSGLDDLPDVPLLAVANEFFDALPVNQWVRTDRGWHQRKVGLVGHSLGFGVDPTPHPTPPKPVPFDPQPGTILEHGPAQDAVMAGLSEHLARKGGAALVIDYGALEPGFGDTLQAVKDHRRADPLRQTGEADLTTHVDFAHLARIALQAGAATAAGSQQGAFLLRLGLLERAGRLGASADLETRVAIEAAVERLASDAGMGKLFKVLGIAGAAIDLPALDRMPPA